MARLIVLYLGKPAGTTSALKQPAIGNGRRIGERFFWGQAALKPKLLDTSTRAGEQQREQQIAIPLPARFGGSELACDYWRTFRSGQR